MSQEPDPTLLPPDVGAVDLPALPADFGFAEEHALLRESARRLLAERWPIRVLRGSSGRETARALHAELASLGWLAVTAADRDSGSGLGRLHVALLLEEMGRALAPATYFASLLALEAIERGGSAAQRARFAPPIVKGETIASVALSEPGGSWEPAHTGTRAEPAADGFTLHGVKTHVLAASDAGLLVVPARQAAGQIGLFVLELPHAGVVIEPELTIDGTRPTARVVLDGARVAPESRLQADGLDALECVQIVGAALLACEMVGAADAVLELTRAYAVERKQFGRAIGSFQAVKHPIVDLLIGVEQARSVALGAAVLLERGARDAEIAARMAKTLSNDVLAFAVKKGVQLHGGFGFTWDCDVHFYFKRMLWSRGTLGDGLHHRRHLAARLLGAI
jgi:alkylation response protein AidB-like acyl-CoA dehydrogenase